MTQILLRIARRLAASIGLLSIRVFRSTFGRNVFKMAGASGASQLIAMAAYPFLTRLYDPEMFGLFGLVLAVATTAGPFMTLRFEFALPIARGPRAASSLLVLGAFTPACAALLVAVSACLLRPVAEPYIPGQSYYSIAAAILFCMVASGWNSVAGAWCVRERAFGLLAVSRFVSGTCPIILQIILAVLAPSVYGLLYGFAAGQIAAGAIAAGPAVSFLRAYWHQAVEPASLLSVAKLFRNFAFMTAPGQAINALGLNLAQMGIVGLYGLDAGGLFALAMRVCGQPTTLIGQSIFNVFWGHAAQLARTDVRRLRREYVLLTAGLAAFALPGLCLFVIGEPLFALVFGPEWGRAGYFAAILFIGDSMGLAATSTESLLVFRRNAWHTAWEIGRLLLQMAVLVLAYVFDFSVDTSVVAISAGRFVSYLGLIGLNYLAIHKEVFRQKRYSLDPLPGKT